MGYKHKIENLKEGRVYLLRMRCRNESGFGPHSDVLTAVTTKESIRFDRYLKQFISVRNKGKEVRVHGNGGADCIYTIIQSSKGFKKGIKRWKIKIDQYLDFDRDMEEIGIVP